MKKGKKLEIVILVIIIIVFVLSVFFTSTNTSNSEGVCRPGLFCCGDKIAYGI